jgi:magnesium-transporting ATPase (P-type)
LFIHGRENYRRNSTLNAYMFYKNIVYVIPQYALGFNSGWSGQVLYDPFMYQMYNMTCTSLPIIWYSTFDFEYVKGIADGVVDTVTK